MFSHERQTDREREREGEREREREREREKERSFEVAQKNVRLKKCFGVLNVHLKLYWLRNMQQWIEKPKWKKWVGELYNNSKFSIGNKCLKNLGTLQWEILIAWSDVSLTVIVKPTFDVFNLSCGRQKVFSNVAVLFPHSTAPLPFLSMLNVFDNFSNTFWNPTSAKKVFWRIILY